MRRVVALSLLLAGCAASTLAVRGAHDGKRLVSRAHGTVAGGVARIALDLENRGDEVIVVDLDSVWLEDGKAGRHRALGRLQRAGRATEAPSEVPAGTAEHGIISVAPGATDTVALDFDGVAAGALTLHVPVIYRLPPSEDGAEGGQVAMKALDLPLAGEATRAAAAPDGGFLDPFVE